MQGSPHFGQDKVFLFLPPPPLVVVVPPDGGPPLETSFGGCVPVGGSPEPADFNIIRFVERHFGEPPGYGLFKAADRIPGEIINKVEINYY